MEQYRGKIDGHDVFCRGKFFGEKQPHLGPLRQNKVRDFRDSNWYGKEVSVLHPRRRKRLSDAPIREKSDLRRAERQFFDQLSARACSGVSPGSMPPPKNDQGLGKISRVRLSLRFIKYWFASVTIKASATSRIGLCRWNMQSSNPASRQFRISFPHRRIGANRASSRPAARQRLHAVGSPR
jgi:hypothetical protein